MGDATNATVLNSLSHHRTLGFIGAEYLSRSFHGVGSHAGYRYC